MTNTYDQSVCLMPLFYIHSVHWGINPPTTNPPSLLPSPLYLQICKLSKPPFLGNLPSVLVFCDPPLKVGFSVFSVNPKNIKGFHS